MESEFKTYVREHIGEYLPDKYKNTGVFFEVVMDHSDVRTAVIIPDEATLSGPRIFLDDLEQDVLHGRDLTDVLQQIASMRVAMGEHENGAEDVDSYDAVRPTLTTKLCDLRYNREYLMDKPWTQYGPFAVFYRVRRHVCDPTSATVVTNSMLDAWGVTAQELHADAFAAERQPSVMYDMEASADRYFSEIDAASR